MKPAFYEIYNDRIGVYTVLAKDDNKNEIPEYTKVFATLYDAYVYAKEIEHTTGAQRFIFGAILINPVYVPAYYTITSEGKGLGLSQAKRLLSSETVSVYDAEDRKITDLSKSFASAEAAQIYAKDLEEKLDLVKK